MSLNDGWVMLFYFFWTSQWYIGIFLFLNFFTLFFINNKGSAYSFFVLIAAVLYFSEVQTSWLSNYKYLFFSFNFYDFNALLFNNFNKYHPYLLYLSAQNFLLVLFLIPRFFITDGYFFNFQRFYITNSRKFFIVFNITLFTLFLGSWWAVQEASWGGWWDWDASETLGLLVLLVITLFLHYTALNLTIFSSLHFFFLYFLLILILLTAYVFVQLNFELTSHNFGIKFVYFFTGNLFYLELTAWFLTIIATLISFFLKNKYSYILFFKAIILYELRSFTRIVIFFSVLLLISFSVISSFTLITNFFFWTFFGLNFLNYVASFTWISFFFISTILFLLVSFKQNSILLLTSTVAITSPIFPLTVFWPFFYRKVFFTPLTASHFILIFFFWLVTLSYNLIFLTWTPTTFYSQTNLVFSFHYFYKKNYSLNFFFYEASLHGFLNGLNSVSVNLQNTLNSLNFDRFFMFLTDTIFINIISLNSRYSTFFLINENPFISLFFSVIFFLLILLKKIKTS